MTTGNDRMRSSAFALPALERCALDQICRRFGHRPFTLEAYLPSAPLDIAEAEWHAALLGLCAARIVRMMRKSWGERLYQVPADVFFEYVRDTGDGPIRESGRTANAAASMTMGERMLAMLLEIERKPLQLTKRGMPCEKDMKRLLKTPASGWNGEETGVGAVLERLDLALRMRLAERRGGAVSVAENRLAQWLKLENRTREEQLFTIWYGVHQPEDAALHWATAAIRLMREGCRMSVEDIGRTLERQGMTVDAEKLEEWLRRLRDAGWIDMTFDEDGTRRICAKTGFQVHEAPDVPGEWSGEPVRSLIVQRDFEILALPHTPFDVIRNLHHMAESLSWDAVKRYRLTKESLYRAFDLGWDSGSVADFLRKHALDGPDESVIDAIERWEDTRPSVRVSSGVFIQAGHERSARMLERHADQMRLVRLSDRHWFAEGRDEREIAVMLDRLGLSAVQQRNAHSGGSLHSDDTHVPSAGAMRGERAGQEHAAPPDERRQQETENGTGVINFDDAVKDALHPQAPGFYTPRDVTYVYREDRFSSIEEELYPEYEQVPAIWHEQYRTYHPSTVRQMFERAIRWKTRVRMKEADEEYEFIPDAIEHFGAECRILGRRDGRTMSVDPEKIEKLKLIVPR